MSTLRVRFSRCALALVASLVLRTMSPPRPVDAQSSLADHFLFQTGLQTSIGTFNGPYGVAIATDGTVLVVESQNCRVQRFSPEGQFIGTWGSRGSAEGRFGYPTGIAVGLDGTVLVSDGQNSRIQRFAVTGEYLGGFSTSGAGIDVAPDGSIYAADPGSHCVRHFSASGTFLGKWGREGWGRTGFEFPTDVAVASDGTVFVVDSGNGCAKHFDSVGNYIGTLGVEVEVGEPGYLYGLAGITIGLDGTVLVSGRSGIYRFTQSGELLERWGGEGSQEGQVRDPRGMTVDSDGTLYVCDTGNQRMQRFSSNGDFLSSWGSYEDGTGLFWRTCAGSFSPNGNLYILTGPAIVILTAQGELVETWALAEKTGGVLDSAVGIAHASDASFYLTNPGSGRVWHLGPDGQPLGSWQAPFPIGIAVGVDSTVYTSDLSVGGVQHFTASGQLLATWPLPHGGMEPPAPRHVAVFSDGAVATTEGGELYLLASDGTVLRRIGGADYFTGLAVGPDDILYAVRDSGLVRFTEPGERIDGFGSAGAGVGQFGYIGGAAVAPDGTLYVLDQGNMRIQAFGTEYPDEWRAEYHANSWLTGLPITVRYEPSPSFLSGLGSPVDGVPADSFSVRWRRYAFVEGGSYLVSCFADDGVRLWIGGRLVIDAWTTGKGVVERTIELGQGWSLFTVEYHDDSGPAMFSLAFDRLGPERTAYVPIAARNPGVASALEMPRQSSAH